VNFFLFNEKDLVLPYTSAKGGGLQTKKKAYILNNIHVFGEFNQCYSFPGEGRAATELILT